MIRNGYLYMQVTDDVETRLQSLFPTANVSDVAVLESGDEWGPWLRDMDIETHADEITEWQVYCGGVTPLKNLNRGYIIRRKLMEIKKPTRYQILRGVV